MSTLKKIDELAKDYFAEFLHSAFIDPEDDGSDAMKMFLKAAHDFAIASRKQANNWMSEDREIEPGFFCVTLVSRDDLEMWGFDPENVSDETMNYLSEQMGNSYVENQAFWDHLEYWAEELKIPKLEEE